MKQNPAAAKVLVAADDVDDAAEIREQLKGELERVRASTHPDRALEDFDDFNPDVLVLAFNSIEKAQGYCLGLSGPGRHQHRHRHGTVLLCTKDEVRAAFDLCKEGFADDYVLFWPLTHDRLRLAMSVWNVARETMALAQAPSELELLAHMKQLGAIESLLNQQLSEGGRHAASAMQTLKQAESAVGAAIDEFSERLFHPGKAVVEVKDAEVLAHEFDRLKNDRVSPAFEATAAGLAPLVAWPRQIKERLALHLAGTRGFAQKVRGTRRIVMVVEDDEVARTLIAAALEGQDYELVFAPDGAAAIGLLRRTRPNLILMDINLPDMDGVALTQKIKAAPHVADVPVLMLTGEARRETLASSMSAGAAGFIVKPFTRAALVAKIERFLPAAA